MCHLLAVFFFHLKEEEKPVLNIIYYEAFSEVKIIENKENCEQREIILERMWKKKTETNDFDLI